VPPRKATPKKAVIKRGKTVQDVAEQNGVTLTDLLDANPELTAPKPGMVLNIPKPGYQGGQLSMWGGYTPGTNTSLGGLSSNAALGGATTNPQGYQGAQVNPWQGATPGYNTQLKPNNFISNFSNPYAGYQTAPQQYASRSNPSGAKPPTYSSLSAYASANHPPRFPGSNQGTAQPQVVQSANNYRGFESAAKISKAAKDDFFPLELLSLSRNETYNLDPWMTKYLEKLGYITPLGTTATTGGTGGYGVSKKRRRGGGGGGGGSAPRTPAAREPAFSTGSGFGGLVNWRI